MTNFQIFNRIVFTLLLSTLVSVQASGEWITLDDGDQVINTFAGKGLDAPDFADFYRKDGAMAYYNKGFDSVVVRKWVVSADGEMCTYIYVKQDHLVECVRFERSDSDHDLYRMTVVDRGYKMQARLIETPDKKLIEAIEDIAGPEK